MLMLIETLNLAAALLHAAQAVTVIALTAWLDAKPKPPKPLLFDGGHFTLERTVRVWNANDTITALSVPSGTVDVRVMMIAFFTLSALFQGAASVFMRGRSGALRYVEYSFSAAVMIMAIALEAGIRDVYTLQCMFVLTWVTMLLGIVAEYVQTPQTPWLWLLPHCAGWVTCVSAYAPILDAFLLSANRSEKQAPSFVRVLVFLEFVMFSCFGFVQAYALTAKAFVYNDDAEGEEAGGGGSGGGVDSRNSNGSSSSIMMMRRMDTLQQKQRLLPPYNYYGQGEEALEHEDAAEAAPGGRVHAIEERAELVFIVLSLAAKTLLCWIILAPTLT
jgi:hypothetical protein